FPYTTLFRSVLTVCRRPGLFRSAFSALWEPDRSRPQRRGIRPLKEVSPMSATVIVIITAIPVALAAFAVGYIVRRRTAEARIQSAEAEAARIIEKARPENEASKREALMEAKEEIYRLRGQLARGARERRHELQRMEQRVLQREEALERKMEQLERREEEQNRRDQLLDRKEAEIDDLRARQMEELARTAGLTREQARELILNQVEHETRAEAAQMMREIESTARQEAERRAKEIVATAIQRYAADYVAETTVSTSERR